MITNTNCITNKNTKATYPIFLTQEELEAIPVILKLAETYIWEVYSRTEDDKFYDKHKANIEAIDEYHKGCQGIMAVGYNISGKAKALLNDVELRNVLDQYINKNNKIEEE
jgi:hypothetical protein